MNVYDFDFTIYRGDCTYDFIGFSRARRPQLWRYLPGQLWAMLRYTAAGRGTPGRRYNIYAFLQALPDVEAEVSAFWDRCIGNIYPYYRALRRPDDLVISASPAFLVAPACRRLGLAPPIASDVDTRTGKCVSVNCYGAEKRRLFLLAHPQATVEAFFSDDLSDAPMAALARQAYLVKGGLPGPWPGGFT